MKNVLFGLLLGLAIATAGSGLAQQGSLYDWGNGTTTFQDRNGNTSTFQDYGNGTSTYQDSKGNSGSLNNYGNGTGSYSFKSPC
jgi:hypothetical protein